MSDASERKPAPPVRLPPPRQAVPGAARVTSRALAVQPTPSPPISAPIQVQPGLGTLNPTSTGRLAVAADNRDDRSRVCPTCFARYPVDFIVCPKDATKLEAAGEDDDPLLGATLNGTYQIIRVIGEGGMGKVYEAKHLRLASRRFAVKVLHAEYARHGDVLTRFQREAEAAAAIAHSHVLEVFDVSRTDDGRPFIVGEYLEGEDFHDFLEKRHKLDVPTTVAIARQVCGALRAAHEAGVVHRDMKPENIFVITTRGVIGRPGAPFVKVLDFGISKVKGTGETNLTRTGMIMGTPNYMAPEQARGEKVDHRVDVYALGAIIYRMVTGKRAFDGTDPGAVITAVLSDEPLRPRALEPSIPESFEVVVQRAMAKDARDRYQSMEELDRALSVFDVVGAAISIAPPPKPGAVTISPSTGAIESKRDEHARTYAGGLTPPPAATAVVSPRVIERRKELEQLEAAGRDAKLARPTIVLLTPIVSLWILGLVVAAAAGVIRATGVPGREVTESEVTLMTLFSMAAGATPLILWIVHVGKHIWRNSVRAMEYAGDMRRFLFGSLASYGISVVAVRVVFTVLMRHSPTVANGWWDLINLFVALLGGAFAGGIGPLARLRRRVLNT
jgi:serine/threonine protein kinase